MKSEEYQYAFYTIILKGKYTGKDTSLFVSNPVAARDVVRDTLSGLPSVLFMCTKDQEPIGNTGTEKYKFDLYTFSDGFKERLQKLCSADYPEGEDKEAFPILKGHVTEYAAFQDAEFGVGMPRLFYISKLELNVYTPETNQYMYNMTIYEISATHNDLTETIMKMLQNHYEAEPSATVAFEGFLKTTANPNENSNRHYQKNYNVIDLDQNLRTRAPTMKGEYIIKLKISDNEIQLKETKLIDLLITKLKECEILSLPESSEDLEIKGLKDTSHTFIDTYNTFIRASCNRLFTIYNVTSSKVNAEGERTENIQNYCVIQIHTVSAFLECIFNHLLTDLINNHGVEIISKF